MKNEVIHRDCKIPLIKEEICRFSGKYLSKLESHQNYLAINLLDNSDHVYRLKRHSILDLPNRFN